MSDILQLTTGQVYLVGSLVSDVAIMSANVTSVSGRLDTVSANLTSVSGRLDALSAASPTSTNVVSISGRLDGVSANLTSGLSRLDAVSASLTSVASIASAAVSAAAAVSGNVTSVASRLDGVSANLTSGLARLDAVSASLTSVASIASAAASAAAAVSANVTSVASRLDGVSANLTSGLARLDTVSAAQTNLSNLVSTIASALSQNTSVLSAQHTSLVSDVGRVSQIVSALGVTGQLAVNTAAQAPVSALAKVSGLSLSLANSVYQIEGMLAYSTSGAASISFGFSTSAAAFGLFTGEWRVMISATSGQVTSGQVQHIQIGTFNTQNTTQVAALPTTGVINWATVHALVRVTTPGSIQMKMTALTGGPLTILQGSFVRAFRIG